MIELFLFNIILNSFLIFFTCVLLVEGALFLFRIRSERIKSIARLIPLFKLVFDCFRYNFGSWAFLDHINPLLCPEGSRSITVVLQPFSAFLIQFFVLGHWTFTVTDVVSTFLSLKMIQGIVVVVLMVSVMRCIFFIRELRIKETVSPYTFAGKIYFPEGIAFTDEEKKAVIEHESSHIRWKDYWVKALCHFLAAIFWWIPLGWWLKRIELSQEKAADQCVQDKVELLSALYKVAKESRNIAACSFSAQFRKRLESITSPSKKCGLVRAVLLTAILFIIGMSRIWIF